MEDLEHFALPNVDIIVILVLHNEHSFLCIIVDKSFLRKGFTEEIIGERSTKDE